MTKHVRLVARHFVYSYTPDQSRRLTKLFRSTRAPWFVTAALLVVFVLLGLLYRHQQGFSYNLSPAAAALVGTSAEHPLKSLKYDAKTKAHTLEGNAPETNSVSVGVNSYGAVLPDKANKGISITDPTTKISLGFSPQFRVGDGKLQQGRMLYPLPNYRNATLVYTLKNNGVEENLVLNKKGRSDTTSFSYKLNLSDGTEARMLPDGSVGIYGADSALLGNITTGSDKDKALLDKARKNSKKTTLIYAIPKPTIKGSNNKATASFTLAGSTLTIQVKHLKQASYPLSIDPSLVLLTGTDWGQGTDEDGNIDFTNPSQVSRAGLTGGSVGGWGSTQMGGALAGHTSIAYNGYLYVMGGVGSGFSSMVQYAQINGDGTVGQWQFAGHLTRQRDALGSALVTIGANTYLYAIGGNGVGCTGTNSSCNDVDFAKINADGTLTTWTATTSLTTFRYALTVAGNNGYLYAIGGCSNTGAGVSGVAGTGCVTNNATVEFAKPNADGTIPAAGAGSWLATTPMTVSLFAHSTVINNGKIYAIGGITGTSGSGSTAVYFSTMSAVDGTLGAWALAGNLPRYDYDGGAAVIANKLYVFGGNNAGTISAAVSYSGFDSGGNLTGFTDTTSLPTPNYFLGTAVSGGRIYVTGGGTSGTAYIGKTYSALVNGDSTISSWISTSILLSNRLQHNSGVYNGFFYIWGGGGGLSYSVDYAAINSNGTLGIWQEGPHMNDGRISAAGLIYNGYIYVYGGVNANVAPLATSEYAKLNRDGSVGTWHTTSSLTRTTYLGSTAVYNGYIYLMGGIVPDTVGNKMVAETLYSKINGDGSLGGWGNTAAFSTKRDVSQASAYNGYIYLAGGCTDSVAQPGTCQSVLSDTQYAKLNADGTITAWSSGTTLPPYHYGGVAEAYGGYLYVAGGAGNSSVIYAPIYANGSIGVWNTTTGLPAVNIYGSIAINNGYLIVNGGYDGSATYYDTASIAKIDPAGVVSAPIPQTTLVTARNGHETVVYNGYVYVLGGCTSGCNSLSTLTLTTSVEYASIGSDGTLSAWTTAANALPQAIGYGQAFAHNGYIYYSGGFTIIGCPVACSYQAQSSTNRVALASTGNTNGAFSSISQAAIPQAIYGGAVASYNDHFYIAGGENCAGVGGVCSQSNSVGYATVYRADFDASNNLSAWASLTAFSGPRPFAQAAVYNGYFYVIGGGGNYNDDIQYDTLSSDGLTLGPSFTTDTIHLPYGVVYHGAAISKGYMYLLGGLSNGTDKTSVYYAKVGNNGALASSFIATQNMVTAHSIGSVSEVNGSFYVIGGCTASASATGCNSAPLNTVERLIVNNGGPGTAGAWTTSGNNFTTPRTGHVSMAANGYLYILGGCKTGGCSTAGDILSDVQYAAINSDGSIGAWASTTSFTTGRMYFTGQSANGYLYIMGGCATYTSGSCSSFLNTVQYAKPSSNGALASQTCADNSTAVWCDASSFASPRMNLASASSNGHLYILGGGSNSGQYADVQLATINVDGSLNAWSTTSSFSTARSEPAAIIYNGYLYLMGGYAGTINLNDVQYAKLNSDGTIPASGAGSWNYTTSYSLGRRGHAISVYNGRMYLAGGCTTNLCVAGDKLSDVQSAPFSANGMLGPWQQTMSISTARLYHSMVYGGNGYLYVCGGSDTTAAVRNDTQYASLQSIPRVAHYTRLYATDKDTTPANILSRFVSGTGTLGVKYNNATVANPNYGTATSYSQISDLKATLAGYSPSSYHVFNFTLDDTNNAVFPDSAGTPSSLSYFQFNYHPNSSMRLRGGKTFNSNIQQGLDTP